MRTRRELKLASRLFEIQCARKRLAETQLSDAGSKEEWANNAARQAQERAADADADWMQCLLSRSFGPEMLGALAARALEKRSQEAEAERDHKAAAQAVEQCRRDWQQLEAKARASETSLRRGRRSLATKSAERRDGELAERTTWNWFKL